MAFYLNPMTRFRSFLRGNLSNEAARIVQALEMSLPAVGEQVAAGLIHSC